MKAFLLIWCVVIIFLFILYCLNHPIELFDECCKPKRSPEVTAIIGPDCNISKQIPNPGQLGVSNSGDFRAMIRNTKALIAYTNALTSSPSLGCNFFVQSGTCNNSSVRQCRGKPRFIYHQGTPNPKSKCLKNIGISTNNKENGGLIPGIIQNAQAMAKSPVGLINALQGKTNNRGSSAISPRCKLETKPVGQSPNFIPIQACVPVYNNLDNNDC